MESINSLFRGILNTRKKSLNISLFLFIKGNFTRFFTPLRSVQNDLYFLAGSYKPTLIGFVLTFVLIASISTNSFASDKLKVVTTTRDLKALVEAIGGDKVEVESIAKGYEDPHFVQAKPSFMIKLNKADMFVKVGLDLEVWSQLLVDGSRNPKIFPGRPGYVDASAGVELLQLPTTQVDRSLGDIHVFGNPHYWLDPLNGKIMLETITSHLIQLDPENADYYQRNKEGYKNRLDDALARWLEKFQPYRGTKIITYHNSWPNFAKRFGLDVVNHIEPKPGVPPTPSHIVSLIQQIKRDNIKAIVMEPYFDQKVPRLVSDKTGIPVVVLPPSVGGANGIETYLGLFDYNLDKLTEAIKESS